MYTTGVLHACNAHVYCMVVLRVCTAWVYGLSVLHVCTAQLYFTSDWRLRGADGANGAHGANETVPWIIGAGCTGEWCHGGHSCRRWYAHGANESNGAKESYAHNSFVFTNAYLPVALATVDKRNNTDSVAAA